jgi:predicted DsbA family dithiol-disulfide isomerase
MAVESDKITATTFEATEFPDLISRYQISGVPKTVVNERVDIMGALPESHFIPQALAGMTLPETEGQGLTPEN